MNALIIFSPIAILSLAFPTKAFSELPRNGPEPFPYSANELPSSLSDSGLTYLAQADGARVSNPGSTELPEAERPIPLTQEEIESSGPSQLPLNEAPSQTDEPNASPAPPAQPTTPPPPLENTPEPASEPGGQVIDSLTPDPNPLLIQTQPEEVDILGTQPITLEQALELAYRNNPDLQIALLELEQSQEGLNEARAALFPTLAVSGALEGINTTDPSSTFITTPDGGFEIQTDTNEEFGTAVSGQLDLVYELFTSGGRDASIQAAERQVRFSELEVERRQGELLINTVNEYYDLQEAIEAIRISQAFLTEAERNLRDTRLREQVGVGTQFDVLRAEVQVANAQQDVVNSQRATEVAQNFLARRLNIPPTVAVTTVPVELADTWPLTLEESIVLAYQNRAELEQQLLRREINQLLSRLELSELGPQVDLFANYRLSDILNQGGSFQDDYQLGARVSWILFEGGAARARARQADLESQISEQDFAETRNSIRLQVETAYADLQANLKNIDTTQLAVGQARRALDLAILRFDAGVGTQLEILDAQSQLTEAEANFVRSVVGYNRALAELERAVSNLPGTYPVEEN